MKIIFLFVLIFGLAAFVKGQDATLSGTVYDWQSAVIPGANVILTAKDGKKYEVKTDGQGNYRLSIPWGVYTIVISHYQFDSIKIKKFRIATSYKGSSMMLDACLEGRVLSGHR